jgi:peptide/nickel transport system substrate-binding protein
MTARGVALCAGLLIVLLAAAHSCSPPGEGRSKELKVGIAPAPDALNPFVEHNASAGEILGLILRPLACWDERWNLRPRLITRLPKIPARKGAGPGSLPNDRSFSGEFDLLPNAGWSDGQSLESRDFLFTYQMAMMPGARTCENRWAGNVATMSAPSTKRLVVTWKSVNYGENIFNLPIPRHRMQGKLFGNPSFFFSPDFGRDLVSNGPYKAVEISESAARFEANRFFPGKPPAFGRLTYRYFSTEDEMVRSLRQGAVDWAIHIPFDYRSDLEKERSRLDVHVSPTGRLRLLCFNLDNRLLQNRRIRKALYLALDRESVVRTLFAGAVRSAGSYLPPFSPFAQDVLPKPDLSRAKKILEEEGFRTLDSDGVRTRQDEKLAFALSFSWADVESKRIASVVKESWEGLGVRVEFESTSAAKFLRVQRNREFVDAMLCEIPLYPWTTLRQLFGKDSIPCRGNHFQGLNLAGWSHPDNELLWRRQTSPLDKEKPAAMWKEHQELFARELPFVPLYFAPEISACRKGFRGWSWRGFGEYSWNAEEWSLGE